MAFLTFFFLNMRNQFFEKKLILFNLKLNNFLKIKGHVFFVEKIKGHVLLSKYMNFVLFVLTY